MKFIHLSDLHIHAHHQKYRGIDPRAHLEAAVSSIRAQFADAALCMVTGDLAHTGEAEAYRDVAEILDRLPCPWYPLMGNHDDRVVARANLKITELPGSRWIDPRFSPDGTFVAAAGSDRELHVIDLGGASVPPVRNPVNPGLASC